MTTSLLAKHGSEADRRRLAYIGQMKGTKSSLIVCMYCTSVVDGGGVTQVKCR